MSEQGSDEWLEERRGKFTASQIFRLMGVKGLGDTGETYIMECVTEELGGYIPIVHTKAMEHGTLTEPFAINHYERTFDCVVEKQPFFIAEWCDQCGCSPDGIVDGKIGVEVKSPYDPTNHIKHLMITTQQELKKQKPQYYWQIQMSMAVTGLEVWNFVSFSDDFTGALKMMVMPIYADRDDIALLKSRIWEAVEIKNKILQQIRERVK